MHISAKARLTTVAIPDPDRHQNLIICSLAHCQPSLKISCKSVRKFLRKVANKQTERQTNNDENITSLAEVITVNLYVQPKNKSDRIKPINEIFSVTVIIGTAWDRGVFRKEAS